MRRLTHTAVLLVAVVGSLAAAVPVIADNVDKVPPQGKAFVFIGSGEAKQVQAFFELLKSKEYQDALNAAQCSGPYDPPDWYRKEHKPHEDKGHTQANTQAIVCLTPTQDTFAKVGQAFIHLSLLEGQVLPQSDLVLTVAYTCTYYVCSGQRKLYKTGSACITPC